MTYTPYGGEEHKSKIMDELHGHLRYWQRQLRLDHWDIILRWKAEYEDGPGTMASEAYLDYNQGIITIQPPEDRTPYIDSTFRRSYEVCLVHELLHMKEIPWRDHPSVTKILDEDKWLKQLHEDSLDAVAEALVRARQGIER